MAVSNIQVRDGTQIAYEVRGRVKPPPYLPPETGEGRERERSDIAVHLAERPKAAKAIAAVIPL